MAYSNTHKRLLAAACCLAVLVAAQSWAGVYESGIVLPRTTDNKTLVKFLSDVQQKSLNSGILNFTPYALLLIKESQQAQQSSQPGLARMYADYACKLAPDTVPVHIWQALLDWEQNRGGRLGDLARNLFSALSDSLSPFNIEDFSAVLFENAAALVGGILLTVAVITFLLTLALLPRLYHDIRHCFPEIVPDYAAGAALALLVAVPLLLRLSLIWLCLWMLALVYSYTEQRTQQVLQGCFVAVLAVAPLTAIMGFATFMTHQQDLQLVWKANYGYCDNRDAALLESFASQKDAAADVYFSLGLIYKRTGSFNTAHKYYEKVLATEPRNYKLVINRGNVFFAENSLDSAIKMYEQASVINPVETAAAYFNLSRVYQQKFMFSESEAALNSAKRLDISRVSQYLKDYTDNYNRLVIDETIAISRLWEIGYGRFSTGSPYVRDLWSVLVGGIPFSWGPIAVLGLLVAMLYAAGRDRIRIAVRCDLCGKAICRRCQQATAAEKICSYCNSLLHRQSRLGYGVKEEKTRAIRRHLIFKKMIGLAAGYAVPGAAHFWNGQTAVGAGAIFLFFLLLMKTIIPLVCQGPWGFLFGPRIFEAAVYGSVLAAYWIGMAYAARLLPGRTNQENLLLRIVS